MIFIYCGILLMAVFPMLITIKRIMKYKAIAKSGNTINAQIIKKELVPFFRGRQIIKLHFQYKHPAIEELITGEATTANNQFNVGDSVKIAIEKNKSKIYIIGDEKGYYPSLGFTIVLFLFACFAVYMIRDMVLNGY